ncbi:MAG: hypothetical protein WAL29_06125, partial [Bacteroidales bacterium]
SESFNGRTKDYYIEEKMCDIYGSCTDRWDCFNFAYGNRTFDFCLSDTCFLSDCEVPPDYKGSVVVTGTWTIEEQKIISSALFPLKYYTTDRW